MLLGSIFAVTIPLIAILALVLLALIILVFEVVMFVHVVRNKHISSTARILWMVCMLIVHPFVAVVYYLTDYKKG